jgi:hypothetical protein
MGEEDETLTLKSENHVILRVFFKRLTPDPMPKIISLFVGLVIC